MAHNAHRTQICFSDAALAARASSAPLVCAPLPLSVLLYVSVNYGSPTTHQQGSTRAPHRRSACRAWVPSPHIITQSRYSCLVLLGCSSGQLITGITTNVSLYSIVHSTLSFVDLYALSRSPFLFALIALQTNHFVPLLAILVGLCAAA